MSTEAEPSNYEYVTARVRTRKSKLFDDDDYRKLVRMQPNEIARFMEESEYSEEINRLGARYTGVNLIEYALYDNMARHFGDIVRWSEGELRNLVVSYLRKYDAWNIKTVLRGIYTEATQEEIEADLIPAGELQEGFVKRLSELDDIEQVVDELSGTVFGSVLEDALREYEETGVLVPIENAVDRAYYERLVSDESGEGAKAVYMDFLKAEIDLLNARNALRAAGSPDLDTHDYFVEGGSIPEEELARLADNREELVNALRESRYGELAGDALDELMSTGSLAEFDRALDELLLEYSERMTNQNPLSIAPVISYILAKEREVNNIRGIARGKEAGLTTEEIEEEVVI